MKLGRDGSTLPGSAAPCGSCHGADGQGRPEGGVRPSAVVWSELAKPYGHSHLGGRKHPPFTDATLARALRDGLDPAGNPLDVSMPRYGISDDDLGSLAAYLRRLEEDLDPGIAPDALRIGTVLPTSGALADVGLPMRAVLTGWFDALNRRGGVHGRKVELVVAGYDSDRADGVAPPGSSSGKDDVFALVSGLFPAAEPEVAVLVGEARVPMVGPFSLFARNDDVAGAWIFHPSGGLREQARVLAAFAVRDLGAGTRRIAVVHAPEAPYAEAARGAADELRKRGGPAPEMLVLRSEPKELADRLAKGGFAAVLVLAGDGALEGLAARARGREGCSRPARLGDARRPRRHAAGRPIPRSGLPRLPELPFRRVPGRRAGVRPPSRGRRLARTLARLPGIRRRGCDGAGGGAQAVRPRAQPRAARRQPGGPLRLRDRPLAAGHLRPRPARGRAGRPRGPGGPGRQAFVPVGGWIPLE